MTGEDGGVVPELRGLHAWLAVHVQSPLRDAMIARDPLGVTLYGDVRNFSRPEKRKVLAALRDEASRYTYFRNQDWNSAPFGALATADMADDFKALLQSPDRSPAHQALLDCVLDAMVQAASCRCTALWRNTWARNTSPYASQRNCRPSVCWP